MNHTSVTFQPTFKVPDQPKQSFGGAKSKRKIEEQVQLPLVSSQPPQPRALQQSQHQSAKMERSKNDKKYFPPGPQKVIRTPVHILKREIQSPPPRAVREKKATPTSPIKELARLQEAEECSSSREISKTTLTGQENPLGEVKSIVGVNMNQNAEVLTISEDKSVSSDNLDLEEMMEGIQEGAVSSTESTKSG